MYNYKIKFNPVSNVYTVLVRDGYGLWTRVHHPLGKILLTRQHAVNFMNWHRRRHPLRNKVGRTEYFY